MSAALGGIVVPAAIYATLVAMGKPVGILVLSMASRLVGARLPVGLRTEDLILVGIVASIEFMVWLFFATAAFPGGDALAQTKMGALFEFRCAIGTHDLTIHSPWRRATASSRASTARN